MHRTKDIPIGEKWQKIADETRDKAEALPPCEQRNDLLKKARQLDVAINLNNWLSSELKMTK